MSNEQKRPPINDPNVIMIEELIRELGLPGGGLVAIEIAQLVVQRLKLEAGKHEPFRIGNTYETQDGDLVTLMGYGSTEFIGTTYETMYDQHGHHRYTNRPGAESGRCTGTNSEWTDAKNIEPLYRRPPSYAVPPLTVMIPTGYKLLADTTIDERSWPAGTTGFGQYINDCLGCKRSFKGDKRQHVCYHCGLNLPHPLMPTAIRKGKGPELMIQHFNYTTLRSVVESDECKGHFPCGYGTRLVYEKPKDVADMTNKELEAQIHKLQEARALREFGSQNIGLSSVSITTTLDGGGLRTTMTTEERTPGPGPHDSTMVGTVHIPLSSAPLSVDDGMPT